MDSPPGVGGGEIKATFFPAGGAAAGGVALPDSDVLSVLTELKLVDCDCFDKVVLRP